MNINYVTGTPEVHREEAAALYNESFGDKFAVAIPCKEKRLKLISESLSLDFSIAAILDGELVGLAGYHTKKGSLTQGFTFDRLLEHLGFWSSIRAALIFSLYERKQKEAELLMDGISVSKQMRGKGIGTELLHQLKGLAREKGYQEIRLDVIDTNPKARQLYERLGFVPKHTSHFGFLRFLLGFSSATTMIFLL
ncbi:GNAT family N-acetyltransferase [Algicola sagamiensis]|uniref:GNAT family N-acetyltransferase n=1 Tax=Algicola sagamiensis TaxID=163869 RepID=UPI00037CB5F9|nr:GNAT family N-acetyltransferase [Algicola sagamiensis]